MGKRSIRPLRAIRSCSFADDVFAAYSVSNIPSHATVAYNASLDDGRRLFVVSPPRDTTSDAFRVFFGEPGNVVERPDVQAAGGSTMYIGFTADGVECAA